MKRNGGRSEAFVYVKKKAKPMQHPLFFITGALLVAILARTALPATAANFHPMVIHSARSSASRLTALANARAGYAAGNPYVSPNATGRRSAKRSASANANAAEIRSAHQSITNP